MINSLVVARGSLAHEVQVGNVGSLAAAFLRVKLILLCDRSSSMVERDAGELVFGQRGRARYEVEDEVVRRLQEQHPGEILLASFGAVTELHPNGVLPYPAGSTPMLEGLKKIVPFCVGDVRAVLISDGEPTDAPEVRIIDFVRQYLGGRLDTAFAGPAGSDGARFLEAVAKAARGSSSVDVLAKPLELEHKLTLMLTA